MEDAGELLWDDMPEERETHRERQGRGGGERERVWLRTG